jgi:hypothetical protein
LEKVSFDKDIFRKELIKSVKWLKNKEVILLRYWCRKKYYKMHPEVIEEVF